MVDRARQTTRKVRFVSEHHSAHLMRADWETTAPVSAESEAALIAYAEAALPQVGAVVLSDYAKGVLTPRVIRAVIDAAKRLGKPVVVDPKSHDYSIYRGATLVTPNAQGIGGRRAPSARERTGHRGRGRRAGANHRLRCGSCHSQRGWHDIAGGGRERRSMFPLIQSRCATCPAPAIRSLR